MAIISFYNILTFDYDTKDFFSEVTPENIKKTKHYVKSSFKKMCKIAKDKFDLTLVWCISETDKGVHAFLVNHYIDVKNDFWSDLLLKMCCDIFYAVFVRSQGFCIRLSKKQGRPGDKVAEPGKKSLDLGYDTNPLKYDYIYENERDLETIKPDLIKLLKFKYRLINYFRNYNYKHLDYVKYHFNREYIKQIRTDLKEIWDEIPEIKYKNELDFKSVFHEDISMDYKDKIIKINKIFMKNFRGINLSIKSPKRLIQSISSTKRSISQKRRYSDNNNQDNLSNNNENENENENNYNNEYNHYYQQNRKSKKKTKRKRHKKSKRS